MLMIVLGTLPSIIAVIKNRSNLLAYSLWGSLAFFIGQLGYITFFALIGQYYATALGLVPTVFWAVVVAFKLRVNLYLMRH
jgi:hypothetical protein